MNGDTLAVMQAISDARAEMLTAIGDLKSNFSGFSSGIEARVAEVEHQQDKQDTRQWVVSAAVIPVVTALHYLANRLGFRV